jgi:Rrf2 family transcriptional regulator, cysteine metabolism repressor
MPMLNRKIDYALLILCYLHHKNEGGCAREIAERYEISRAFVANILKDLCQQNFVSSHRGVKGGYLLQPLANERSLADLIDALDDTFQVAECNAIPAEGCCDLIEHCPIRVPIAAVHRRIRDMLEGIKLVDLFQEPLIERPVQLSTSRCELASAKSEEDRV